MEALAIHTGASTVHLEDNTSCIYVIEAQRVTHRVNQNDIPVCFVLKKFDNCLFITKNEKSSVMQEDMCTRLCS